MNSGWRRLSKTHWGSPRAKALAAHTIGSVRLTHLTRPTPSRIWQKNKDSQGDERASPTVTDQQHAQPRTTWLLKVVVARVRTSRVCVYGCLYVCMCTSALRTQDVEPLVQHDARQSGTRDGCYLALHILPDEPENDSDDPDDSWYGSPPAQPYQLLLLTSATQEESPRALTSNYPLGPQAFHTLC